MAERLDRTMIAQHLALAEAHAAQGARHVARQREIVDELARDGHDNRLATELLWTFETTQACHVSDVSRLKKELEEFG
ncbi:MAG TPA: hypothetical protein VM146_00740 [Steroidobacteraceae bacterium]|nr:hypothetical protein [Steroidobacteraceae bacterium]